jgi:hypothetical protein
MSEVIGDLNNEISTDEIIEAIRSIRNGKTASTYLISNEMLKNAVPILIKPLQKLFNLIFKNGTFPKILVLLHKKGDTFDPGNYRGISSSSNLGKLFNKVIYKRLLTFMNNTKLISKNQIGFKEKSHTADHIFTLKTIIDQYKQKSKNVFTAFIDLKKAFATIWRLALFYKLLKHNIPHRIFNIIHSMYTDTICRITFSSERGGEHGDVLSPILLNYFINNLVDDLNKDNTDPVVIGDTLVNILLYADDIVLLSQSKEGLQNSLNILHDFCYS